MAPVKNGMAVYVAEPSGFIEPGVHVKYVEREIDLDNVPLQGGVLLKTLALGSDPYIRYRMRDPNINMFCPPILLGDPVDNIGIGKVIRSNDPNFKPGELVTGYFDFAEYSVYPAKPKHFFKMPLKKLDKHPDIPATVYLGTLGLAGITAYTGFKEFLEHKVKDAKTIFITVAGGPLGTFLVEYIKIVAPHLKIIASAGSDEKVELLRRLGAQVPFNYKKNDTFKILQEHGPLDIYWDNVGGAILDAALLNMNFWGTIIACGCIDATSKDSSVHHWHEVFQRSLSIHGYIVYSGPSARHLTTFYEEIVPLIMQGKITYREQRYHGLQEAAHALADHHTGKNHAKSVIVLADD